jgi:hypothetical protein
MSSNPKNTTSEKAQLEMDLGSLAAFGAIRRSSTSAMGKKKGEAAKTADKTEQPVIKGPSKCC